MSNATTATDIGTRIAHHLHAIARALAAPPDAAGPLGTPPAPARPPVMAAGPAEEAPPGGEETFLSLDGTIDLGNGSRMFAGPIAGDAGWAVLQGVLTGGAEPSAFDLKGILAGALTPAAFVTGAYRMLLDREPDQQGLSDYLPVLASANGRAEVLRLLASSGEASGLPRHLIIAPESMLAGDP